MDGDAFEVGDRLGAVALRLRRLARGRAVDGADVRGDVLELHVRDRHRADVESGARIGHPGSRGVLPVGRDHVVGRVGDRIDEIGPVGERAPEAVEGLRRLGGQEEAEGVGDGLTLMVGIDAGERRQDVVGRMGDERRVVMRDERPLVSQEIEEIGHLLDVGRNVGVVARQVHVVELHVDDVLNLLTRSADGPVGGQLGRSLLGRRGGRFDGSTGVVTALGAPAGGKKGEDRGKAQLLEMPHGRAYSEGARALSMRRRGRSREPAPFRFRAHRVCRISTRIYCEPSTHDNLRCCNGSVSPISTK